MIADTSEMIELELILKDIVNYYGVTWGLYYSLFIYLFIFIGKVL